MGQFPRMRNLPAAHRANLIRGNRDDCGRLSGESDELDLVCLVSRIDMNDRPDVASLKAIIGEKRGQHHPVVFVNHAWRILERMRSDKSRRIAAAVDDPDRSNGRSASVRARKRAVNAILGTILGLGKRGDRMCSCVRDERLRQSLPLVRRESETGEELRLASSLRMLGRKEVVTDLGSFDDGIMCVREIHRPE